MASTMKRLSLIIHVLLAALTPVAAVAVHTDNWRGLLAPAPVVAGIVAALNAAKAFYDLSARAVWTEEERTKTKE